ncbi:uncharacterized protein LOC111023438 [Momordica charantia]|uniref:Uncharacterized protein LOC111023438 n=1 Tax=Momordica charantia TaxID=3673 RepID=A0A6J1DQZ0_MOMCH|nr:uncharacterized protein LOC111023438 [Momordica charantia]
MRKSAKAHKLFGFVDGSDVKPSPRLPYVTPTDVPQLNPTFEDWIAKDHALMTVINATFTVCSGLRFVKKPLESIDQYIQRIKEFKDKLAKFYVLIDDEDLIIYALNGLTAGYNTFRTSMHTREKSNFNPNVGRGRASGKNHFSKAKSPNFAPTGNYSTNVGRGRGLLPLAPTGKSSQEGFSSTIFCQICLKIGHSALDCFNRMNYSFQGRHPPIQLTAMVANHNYATLASSNPSWLTDSGCNAHVTADLDQLSTASEYSGDEQIGVGTGQSLPIAHTSSGILHTSTSSLKLCNLLHVPTISSNLLSVHQLCVDNNCFVVFDYNYFYIQDKFSGMILFQGPSQNG